MADLLLSASISVVLRKAADALFQRIGEVWGIDDQHERLHDLFLQIQSVLPNAEQQANSNIPVKLWLEKLKLAADDADDLLDEFCYEELHRDAVRRGHKVGNVSAFFSLENPALLRYKMSEKLKKVVERVNGLVVQMGCFGFVHGMGLQVANQIRTDSLVVESNILGRDEDKQRVVQLLLQRRKSDDLMVVPIVGMGGLGKTTLAQLVYNDPRVKEYFNLQFWVCVSKEFNICYIVKSIIELVEGECNLPIDNMELLKRHLHRVLSKKRYIIVLDDVWNESVNEWERLRALLNCGVSRSAIIVTTRSSRVAFIMGTVESYNLECLGEEDSWSLFEYRAFSKGVKKCHDMVIVGRKLVHNCRGLPLAINILGGTMGCKFEVQEWLAVLEQNMIWEQRPDRDEVLSVLKLSYDHLPSYMKQCFAFCAVYPKDYEMDKEKLIQLWMANGFIPSEGPSSLEMRGNNIFNELASRSFLHEVRQVCPVPLLWRTDKFAYRWGEGHCSKTKCKMHDLIHDLAQSIMHDRCLSLSEVPTQLSQPMVNGRHVSVRTTPLDINKVTDGFPSIRSFILPYRYGSNDVKNIGFLKSNSLRILELNGQLIKKTIVTPDKMKHLRYLELSIYKITSLPEAISTLYFLQTLRLFECCYLEKLPEGMRYMSNLRHLHINGDSYYLRSMPKGIGQLNCLQILTTYIVGTEADNGIRELNRLNNLHGQLHLYNLSNIKHVVDAREANLIGKQNLDDLALCWGMPIDCRNFDLNIPESNASEVMHCDPFEVLDALKPCNNLKVLHVILYKGNKFPVWMSAYQTLENLIELYIIGCRECTEIPPAEKLPFLRILILKYLDNLRHLCSSASTSTKSGKDARVAFPSLKNMVLSEMPELCSWCEGEVGNRTTLIFPELKTIDVTNCPKLSAMPIVPSLMRMSVKGNKNLSCFATGLTTLHDLSLESNGENESLSFQPWETLKSLSLTKYNNIVPLGAKEGEMSITPTKCRTMLFSKVSNIPSNTSFWFWRCFAFLEILHIQECYNLIYWPENEFRSLNCLIYIHVNDCPNFLGSQLVSPIERSVTEVVLPTLQNLFIHSCPNVVEIPKCSTSVQVLSISKCPQIQRLPEWLGSMIALIKLEITQCESLNSLPLSIGDLTCLEVLDINGCPNLASIPEGMEGLRALMQLRIKECPKIMVLPEGMEGLTALEQLKIEECPKIRVLPEGLLQQLRRLDELLIKGCPHLERHFRKFGRYRPLISTIRVVKFGEE